MSIADESVVPHRPPQVGDEGEVRMRGRIVAERVRDGIRYVGVEVTDDLVVWRPAEEVPILREVPLLFPRQ